MKKILIIFALLVIPAFSCFAGDFYSNIVVLSTESGKMLPVLLQMGITAFYAIKNNIGVIYEEKIDDQDIGYGINLASEISQKLNTTVFYSTNHDSDVLVVFVYKNGEELFFYNSNPGYFEGENTPPAIKNIDQLLLAYNSINKEEFLNILTTEEIFSEDIHRKIIEKLNLPEYSVDVGYNTLKCMDKSDIEEILENEYEIKIERIGK